MVVTLRVFVYGLLLIVPDSNRPTHLTVVFPDARAPRVASDGCPIHQHEAKLIHQVDGKAVKQCSPWCKPVGSRCECPLERVDLSFYGLEDKRHAWKEEDDECFDTAVPEVPGRQPRFLYRWLGKARAKEGCTMPKEERQEKAAKMKGESAGCCGDAPADYCFSHDPSPVPVEVLARAHAYHPDPLRVCQWISQDKNQAQELAFRSMTRNSVLTRWNPMNRESLISEVSVIPLQVDACPAEHGGYKVRIWLESFGRTSAAWVDVPVFKQAETYFADLVLSHAPAESHGPYATGRCMDHAIGRDFELLSDLLDDPLDFEKRRVPMRTAETKDENEMEDVSKECPWSIERPEAYHCESALLKALLEDLHRSPKQPDICAVGQGRGGGK